MKLLDSVSLSVPTALRLAVIGSAGSGKDVLGQMLARLVLPTGGSVRLDGKDFFQVPEYLLGARTAYVGQDTYLFPLSVRDNLLFGQRRMAAARRRSRGNGARPGTGGRTPAAPGRPRSAAPA